MTYYDIEKDTNNKLRVVRELVKVNIKRQSIRIAYSIQLNLLELI